MSAVRLVPLADRGAWDQVVRATPGSAGFHEWDVLDLTERLLRVRIERLAVERGHRTIGVWPVLRGHGPVAPAAPFPYLGPLVAEADLPAAVAAFRDRQLRERVLVAPFELPPGLMLPAAPGVTAVTDETVVVPTGHGSEAALVAGYSRNHRRALARAAAAGVVARPARTGELAALLPVLLDESYGQRGVRSPYPADAGALIEAWAADRDDVSVQVAVSGAQPVGALVMLAAASVDLLWLGGCLRSVRDTGANVLLHHAQLTEALRRGATAVDLVGAVDPGVRTFKLGFGGAAVPYVRAQSRLGPAPLWRAVHTVRALGRSRAGVRAAAGVAR